MQKDDEAKLTISPEVQWLLQEMDKRIEAKLDIINNNISHLEEKLASYNSNLEEKLAGYNKNIEEKLAGYNKNIEGRFNRH